MSASCSKFSYVFAFYQRNVYTALTLCCARSALRYGMVNVRSDSAEPAMTWLQTNVEIKYIPYLSCLPQCVRGPWRITYPQYYKQLKQRTYLISTLV